MEQLRVGVIGLGRMGQQHCRVFSTLRRAQLVGVYDLVPNLSEEIAARYEVVAFPSVDSLLAEVEAVSLATPTPVHFDLAMTCVQRGIPVLVEKPLAETIEQADALAEASASAGVILQVGHIERFNPAYTELKNVLEDKTPLAIAMRRLSAFGGSNHDVDVVLDLMIHDIDLALDLTGQEPDSFSAFGLTAHDGDIDHAVVHLGFGAGPLVTMTASRVTEQKIRSIEVTALEAYVEADLLNKSIAVHRRTTAEYLNHNQRGIKYRQESILEGIHVPTQEPLYSELQHFVDCVLDNRQPVVSANEGKRALLLATAIRREVLQRLRDAAHHGGREPRDLRPAMMPIAPA